MELHPGETVISSYEFQENSTVPTCFPLPEIYIKFPDSYHLVLISGLCRHAPNMESHIVSVELLAIRHWIFWILESKNRMNLTFRGFFTVGRWNKIEKRNSDNTCVDTHFNKQKLLKCIKRT